MNRTLKIADGILDLIGEIPLVRLNRIGKETGANSELPSFVKSRAK